MAKETRFYAVACNGCEQTKPEKDVLWTIYALKNHRAVGYLTEPKIDGYGNRVMKTSSSTTCPPCAAIGLHDSNIIPEPTVPDLQTYHEGKLAQETKDPYQLRQSFLHSIDLYYRYLRKNNP